jgi:hypothetical protein
MNQPHADNPRISSICPDDLGLKAGFWTSNKRDQITFRPIVGWVSVTNYIASQKLPFCALVLNELNELTFASQSSFPNYAGIFAGDATEAEALDRIRSLPPPRPSPPSTLVGRPVE